MSKEIFDDIISQLHKTNPEFATDLEALVEKHLGQEKILQDLKQQLGDAIQQCGLPDLKRDLAIACLRLLGLGTFDPDTDVAEQVGTLTLQCNNIRVNIVNGKIDRICQIKSNKYHGITACFTDGKLLWLAEFQDGLNHGHQFNINGDVIKYSLVYLTNP